MYIIKQIKKLNAQISVPADKSISHRALIISSLTNGQTTITPFIKSDDTLATLECIRRCGVNVTIKNKKNVLVKGHGLYYLSKKKISLSAKESGTTFRIFSGILCGQKFPVHFDAAPALKARPMKRITSPLRMMGANIQSCYKKNEEYPPFDINPTKRILGIKYRLPIPSAQVKSAVLLASLYATDPTQIIEPSICRNHTELMLKKFKATIKKSGKTITLNPNRQLSTPGNIFIPSDFSSAAFFIVLGLILKHSKILIKDVNLNPTRCGLLAVLKRMGANIEIFNLKKYFEPYGDILIKSSNLTGTIVKEKEMPLMIDEIPILCVAANFANSPTIINGLNELKVKETDRISSTIYNIQQSGGKAITKKYKNRSSENWQLTISPGKYQKKAEFKSFFDHRTAMSAIIMGSALKADSVIENISCINKSFPEFIHILESLANN